LNSAQCSFLAGVAEKSLARTELSDFPEGSRASPGRLCQVFEQMNEMAEDDAFPGRGAGRNNERMSGRAGRNCAPTQVSGRSVRRAGNSANRPRRHRHVGLYGASAETEGHPAVTLDLNAFFEDRTWRVSKPDPLLPHLEALPQHEGEEAQARHVQGCC
jgi:hypothetical protein